MRYDKYANLFLGGSMFIFGFLKFFDPFKEWYSVQIFSSQLGEFSYILGVVGELSAGLTFLALSFFRVLFSTNQYTTLSSLASGGVVVMMITGVYVHLHPDVPANVLPLNIKPPFIPVVFALTALINLIIVLHDQRRERRKTAF